jgi:hypothetical protein
MAANVGKNQKYRNQPILFLVNENPRHSRLLFWSNILIKIIEKEERTRDVVGTIFISKTAQERKPFKKKRFWRL